MDMMIRVDDMARCSLFELPPYRLFVGKDVFLEYNELPEWLLGRITMIRGQTDIRAPLAATNITSGIGWRLESPLQTLVRDAFCLLLDKDELARLRAEPIHFVDTVLTQAQLNELQFRQTPYQHQAWPNTPPSTLSTLSTSTVPSGTAIYGAGNGTVSIAAPSSGQALTVGMIGGGSMANMGISSSQQNAYSGLMGAQNQMGMAGASQIAQIQKAAEHNAKISVLNKLFGKSKTA